MKTIVYLYIVLAIKITTASAAEISLGGGHNFVTNDYSSGLGETSSTSSGGLAVQAQFLLDSVAPGLKFGIETGYLKYSHAEYPANSNFGAYTRDEFNIPILAVGRYEMLSDFYVEAKAGITLDRISTNLDPSDSNTTPYLALGAGIGYSIRISNSVSIDPRVNTYVFFISGAYTQVAPSISLAYRL